MQDQPTRDGKTIAAPARITHDASPRCHTTMLRHAIKATLSLATMSKPRCHASMQFSVENGQFRFLVEKMQPVDIQTDADLAVELRLGV